jgi:hypothetical protein
MPQFVAAVKAVAAAWAAFAKAHAVAAFFIKVAAMVAVSYGVGKLVGRKMPRGTLGGSSPLQMTRDPVATRRVILGQTRVSGPVVFAHVAGANNEYLYLVIPLAGHEVAEIGDVYFDDQVVPITGDQVTTGTYAGHARIWKFLGTPDQTADPNMVSELPGVWTTSHRLRGNAALTLRLKYNQEKFPGGWPNISAVVKGAWVIDPRDSQEKWSDNPALLARWYLLDTTVGMKATAAEIDEASFIAAANVCDELVDLAAGGTEKRYTCNGSFETSAEPASVLDAICSSMAGTVVYVGGKWYCHAGAHEIPTVTLDESDLRGPISVQTKLSMRDTCNRVKGTFSSPAEKWQPTDFTPITNATYLAEDGDVEIWRDIDLPLTTSHSMAQRLAKIELERTRQGIIVEAPCLLSGLRARAGKTVKFTILAMGWEEKEFIVTNSKVVSYEDNKAPAIGVDLVLRETAAAIYDWANGEETTYDPAPNSNLGDPRAVVAPTGLLLESGGTITILQTDGTVVPRLKVTWTAPADQHVQTGGQVRIEYKVASSNDWIEWATVKGTQTLDYITDVKIAVDYDVRIRAENLFGIPSEWVSPAAGAHTVLGDTTAPTAPTGVTASVGTGKAVSLSWNKHTDPRVAEYGIYRHSSNVPESATKIAEVSGTRFVDLTMPLDDASYYWVTAISGSEVESDKSTGTSATPASILEDQGIDSTPPPNPSAPTLLASGGSGVKVAGDGTVSTWLKFTLPALTGNAVGFNLFSWTDSIDNKVLADQIDEDRRAAGAVFGVDDLPARTSIHVGLQQYSAYGYCSEIVEATDSPFLTAYGPIPQPPSSTALVAGNDSSIRPPPRLIGGEQAYALTVTFADSSSRDALLYEVVATAVDTDGAASMLADNGAGESVPPGARRCHLYTTATANRYIRIRTFSTSSQVSSWVRVGDAQAYWAKPVGSLIERNANAVGALSGITSLALTSSRRYKKDFRALDGKKALAELKQWNPSSFRWRKGRGRRGRDVGFPAEDVAKVRPTAVVRQGGKVDSLEYTKSTPLLAAASIYLADEVAALKRELRKRNRRDHGNRAHRRR